MTETESQIPDADSFANLRLRQKMKALVKDHLTRLGVWKEAVKYREGLKKAGVDQVEAWNMMARKFWTEDAQKKGEELRLAAINDAKYRKDELALAPNRMFKGKQTHTHNDIRWVAEHMNILDIGPKDSPSKLAWSLLCWAREKPEHRTHVMTKLLPLTVASKQQIEASEAVANDDTERMESIIDRVKQRSQ